MPQIESLPLLTYRFFPFLETFSRTGATQAAW